MHILSPLNDKRLFGDTSNSRPLVSLLKAALNLNQTEFSEISILNPYLHPDFRDDKLGILDIKLKTRSGIAIDVEMQVCVTQGPPPLLPGTAFHRAAPPGSALRPFRTGREPCYSPGCLVS